MSIKPILYVLVGKHGGPQFSPFVFKTLCCFFHKQAPFEVRELTWTELRAKQDAWKTDRPRLPTIELPSGEIISDSNKIAEWLESTYPDRSSLFVPTLPTSQVTPESLAVAKAYNNYVNITFGNPATVDAPLPLFVPIHQGILSLIEAEKDREYFKSDYKLGFENAWETMSKTDPDVAIKRAKGFVVPFESFLATSQFLNGDEPGIVDYTVYGRYAFARVADPVATKSIWKSSDTPQVVEWIERIEKRLGKELEEVKRSWPKEE